MGHSGATLLVGSCEPFSGKSALVMGLVQQLRDKGQSLRYGKPLATSIEQQTSGDTQPPVVFNKPHPRNRDHDKVIQVDITGAQQHHALPQGPRGPSSSGDASIHDDGDDVSDA